MPEPEQENTPSEALARVPEHLRPFLFQKGESGNPGGRPKGTPTTVSGLMKLAMKAGGADLAVREALKIMANGNHKHFPVVLRDMMDRTEGKVADRIQHEMKRFEEGVTLKDGRDKLGPVPLPTVIDQPAKLE
jgi:hypothetical protein